MKRTIRVTVLMLVLVIALSTVAFADMGPKPSVNLILRGFGDEEVYITLLAGTEGNGPWGRVDENTEPPLTAREIWLKFADFEDPDGYCFWGELQKAELREDSKGTYHWYTWGYYPPEQFKVLLYFPAADEFVLCDTATETYAFESWYEVTMTGEEEPQLTVTRTYGYTWEVVAFLARLLATIIAEVALALAFGFIYKRQLGLILVINVITQLFLNIVLQKNGYPSMFIFYVLEYFVLELVVFCIEAVAYASCLRKWDKGERNKMHPVLYAFCANLASFLLGYAASHAFPFAF